MAICGAGVVPPLMSVIADHAGALHWSLFVPALCYVVVLSFALMAPRLKTA